MNKVYARKRQTKTGYSWEWRFEAPKGGEKRKQISKSGYRSESEALAAGYAEINRRKSEGIVSEASITMNELLSEYTEQILLPGLAKGTADNYRSLTANHISPAIGSLEISEITSGIILDLYNKVRLAEVSQFPLEGIRRILNGAFEYATVRGYIASDPMNGLKLPKSINKTTEKSAYTPHQIQLMSRALLQTNDRRLPFQIAALTGMRESEIAGLQWSDIDMNARVIHVRQQLHCNGSDMYFGPTKTGAIRDIPFGDMLSKILIEAKKRQIENKEKWGKKYRYALRLADSHVSYDTEAGCAGHLDMVCTKADGRCLQAWDFKAISSVIKDAFDDEFSFHLLRHSHATIALDSGAGIKAVADRLGHKDVRTTLAVYTHVSPAMRTKTAELIEEEFSDSSLELVHTA